MEPAVGIKRQLSAAEVVPDPLKSLISITPLLHCGPRVQIVSSSRFVSPDELREFAPRHGFGD